LDKNNERPDWMTDLKHADCEWLKDASKRNLFFISNFHHSPPPPPKGYKIVSLIID
jgi:hypothetical protein